MKTNKMNNENNAMTEIGVDQIDNVSGGYIYYNEQEGVYEVINCIGEVIATFKDRYDAIDYARKLYIPDFEVTPYFISILRGTAPKEPNQELLDDIIRSLPMPTNS